MTNNRLEKWIIREIKEHLNDYEGQTLEANNFAYELFENDIATGSYTCSIWQSSMWIKEYFEELGEIVEQYENDLGMTLPNPFNEPEQFQLSIIVYLAGNLLYQVEYISDNWNDEIVLDCETIQMIIQDLEDK